MHDALCTTTAKRRRQLIRFSKYRTCQPFVSARSPSNRPPVRPPPLYARARTKPLQRRTQFEPRLSRPHPAPRMVASRSVVLHSVQSRDSAENESNGSSCVDSGAENGSGSSSTAKSGADHSENESGIASTTEWIFNDRLKQVLHEVRRICSALLQRKDLLAPIIPHGVFYPPTGNCARCAGEDRSPSITAGEGFFLVWIHV